MRWGPMSTGRDDNSPRHIWYQDTGEFRPMTKAEIVRDKQVRAEFLDSMEEGRLHMNTSQWVEAKDMDDDG